MSRRNANTTINPSLRFLNVQAVHGEALVNVAAEANTKTCVALISTYNKKDYKYLIKNN